MSACCQGLVKRPPQSRHRRAYPPSDEPACDDSEEQYGDLEVPHAQDVELGQQLRKPNIEVAIAQLIPHVGDAHHGLIGDAPDHGATGILNAPKVNGYDFF